MGRYSQILRIRTRTSCRGEGTLFSLKYSRFFWWTWKTIPRILGALSIAKNRVCIFLGLKTEVNKKWEKEARGLIQKKVPGMWQLRCATLSGKALVVWMPLGVQSRIRPSHQLIGRWTLLFPWDPAHSRLVWEGTHPIWRLGRREDPTADRMGQK